ncbi:MAG: hypothetical protein ACJ72V_00250, partial [Nitrososphaeraceae archaeon]
SMIKMLHYAGIIQELQDDLGLPVSSFHDIGKSALAFYSLRAAQIVQKNNSNSGNNNNDHNHTGNANQEQISEEYLTDNDHIDQYEQECLTDDNAYSEYFRDDYNEADRFTL